MMSMAGAAAMPLEAHASKKRQRRKSTGGKKADDAKAKKKKTERKPRQKKEKEPNATVSSVKVALLKNCKNAGMRDSIETGSLYISQCVNKAGRVMNAVFTLRHSLDDDDPVADQIDSLISDSCVYFQ